MRILALLYNRSDLSNVLPPSANITVSNVPGAAALCRGCGIAAHLPGVDLDHGIALNITVQSYRDQLDFGFIAGANIIPHVQVCGMLPVRLKRWRAAFAPPPSMTSAAE